MPRFAIPLVTIGVLNLNFLKDLVIFLFPKFGIHP